MSAPREAAFVEAMRFLSTAFRRADAIPDDAALAEAAKVHVTGNDRLSPAEQVDIYRRQYWLRHIDALLEDYPGAAFLAGEEAFDAFLRAYLEAHPPKTPSLRDLGADTARFAEGYDFGDKSEIVREMIRYELAFVDVFDGPEAPALDAAKLRAIPEDGWDRARIVLNPSIARLRCKWPVHRIRLAVKEKRAPELTRGDYPIVLFRKDLMIHFEDIAPDAFLILEMLSQGASLVAACEAIAPENAGYVAEWFQAWTSWKWIIDVEMT